jgi:transglutaminase-like putative cysteine protease
MRFRRLLSGLAVTLAAFAGRAQDPVTGPLPDSLREGAFVVSRQNLVEITIESPRKIRVRRKWTNTILNNNGDAYSLIYTFYDKFHDLSKVTATLYDADGKPVKKIKKSDLEDALIGGMGMLEVDTRVKYYQFAHRSYPYTIDYEEEQVLNNGFVLPSQWYPQASPRMAVVSSSLVVHTPDGYNLRYKEYDCPGPVVTPERNGGKTYTWTLSHLPAKAPEPYAVAWHRREPGVRLAPTDFEIAGYKGAADSWGHLGQFNSDLFQGRGQLPEEARQKVHALTDGLTDTAKIAALYSWLQANTHYVGIELGIGGWQPYDATYVYKRKYGDCKALANYMVALLKEAGIRAWPVLIYGGSEPPLVDSAFPCLQFNHCIAVAMAGADSVWLECTSNTLPAGYLGSFTSDREALLLDGPDAHLVHTPVYGVRENRLTRRLEGTIADNGSLQATLRAGYKGLEQDAPRGMIDRLSKKDLLEERRQALGLNDCTVSDYNYVSTRTAIPTLDENMRLSAEHFATVNGNRLIIVPGRFWRRTSRLQTTGPPRQTAIELRVSIDEDDTLVLQIPPGYMPEHLPSGRIGYPFGSYSVQSRFENGVLTVACHYEEQKGVYSAATYEKMARFFDFTWRSGNQQIVFVKQ